MALLSKASEEKQYDVRLLERNLTRGVMTHKDREKFLKGLSDDGVNALWVNTEHLASGEGRSGSNGFDD